jgi:hypothetical protein
MQGLRIRTPRVKQAAAESNRGSGFMVPLIISYVFEWGGGGDPNGEVFGPSSGRVTRRSLLSSSGGATTYLVEDSQRPTDRVVRRSRGQ